MTWREPWCWCRAPIQTFEGFARSCVPTSALRGQVQRPVLDFARQAIAPLLSETSFQNTGKPAEDRFREIVDAQAPGLRQKSDARRSLNVILLALDILADAGLSMEQAVPTLRQALAEHREPVVRSNPRRERLAQLADPRMTVDQLRRTLGLIEPWEQWQQRPAQLKRRRSRTQGPRGPQKWPRWNVSPSSNAGQGLRAGLESSRQEVAVLRDQLRDAGSANRNDVSAARARTVAFLKARVRPTLQTGREAAEVKPPNERVMRRMILDTLHDIDKEIEWLTSSA